MIHMEFVTRLGVRLLNRLRLGFSHLREHRFTQGFTDTLNPLCSCSLETEDTEHYILHCQNNLSLCTTLLNDLNNVNASIFFYIMIITRKIRTYKLN